MMRVLLIDDDKIDREAIKRHISRSGREVLFVDAQTGQEAFGLLSNKTFDIVFLDYQLPDMDGISLLRQLYDPETDLTTAPIVMLTGQGNEAVMADALRWGAQDYLIKSNISQDTLMIAIKKARELYELKLSRKQAEDQIRQIQKMDAVGLLTSGVAHDFNNLLTVILGNTRLARKKLHDEGGSASKDDLLRKIEAVEAAACKGADLVKRLMVFTRQRPLNHEIVNLNSTINETCSLIKDSLGSGIEVELNLSEDYSPIQVDPGLFENALINIAMNAKDAMPDGGKLMIETKLLHLNGDYALSRPDVKQGDYMMIAISDTGNGMSSSVVKRIFDPFFTTKKMGEGTGLGLSMVYGFIRQSGGHIQVYSEEGHGTTFKVYLPCKTKESISDISYSEEDLTGDETILVVEDDNNVSNAAISILRQLGYRVLHAQSSEMGLQVLQKIKGDVDLVLVDVFLHNTTAGLDFVDEAKKAFPHLKVIYTSGFMKSMIADYKEIEEDNFLSKPYSREQLAEKVRSVLGHREVAHEKKTVRFSHR